MRPIIAILFFLAQLTLLTAVPGQQPETPSEPEANPVVELLPPQSAGSEEAQFDGIFLNGVPLYLSSPRTSGFSGEQILDGQISSLYRENTTRGSRLPGDQLPIASDPSDFQSNPLYGPPVLGVASQSRIAHLMLNPTSAEYSAADPTLAFGAQVRPGLIYDSGAIENSTTNSPAAFNPGNIILDNTPGAHQRGNVYFVDFPNTLETLPVRLQAVSSFGALSSSLDMAQLYADGILLADSQSASSLRGRSLFARLYSGDVGVVIGKAETAFGDLGSAPMLVNTGGLPVGAVGIVDGRSTFTGVSQLRVTRHWNDDAMEAALSLEDQSNVGGIPAAPAGATAHHYPAFVGRIRYHADNQFDSFQISGLIRPMAINDVNFVDHNATGWGINGIVRLANAARTDALYCGVAGGRGIGGYLYGNISAVTYDANQDIQTLASFGTYVAYQHVWINAENSRLSSNVTYGYLSSEASAANDNHLLHQVWANLLWNTSEMAAFGVEYQYGSRVVGSGNHGDDHRIAFVAQFQTEKKKAVNGFGLTVEATDTGRRPLSLRRL